MEWNSLLFGRRKLIYMKRIALAWTKTDSFRDDYFCGGGGEGEGKCMVLDD